MSIVTAMLRALAAVAAFAAAAMPHTVEARATVTVFAAASLQEALDELARRFEKSRGKKIVVSYAGSSMLARQIERGAPADLFISADLDWMDYLAGKRLIRPESRATLLTNSLVLIAPAGSALKLGIAPGFGLARALGSGRLAMADTDYVPAGKYGRAALEALGVWQSVAARVVRGENVRAALAFVARGEAPLGIVYRTDALAEPRVRIVAEFPQSLHPAIVYPAALVTGRNSPDAAEFLRYLQSPEARAIWQRHGFGTGM
jgi:molybdate transport system substrate-binding protein